MAKMMVNAMANSRLYIQDVCKMLVGLAWSYHGFNDNSETTKQLRSGCYPSGKPTPPWDSMDIAVFFSHSHQGDRWRLFVSKHRTENTLVNCEHVEIQSPEKTTKKSQLWESEDQNLAETSTFWSKQNSK